MQDGVPIVLDLSATRRRQWNISPDGTAALTIAEVRRTDAGKWECRELGSDGSVRKIARVLDLIVGSSPSDPYLELEGRRLVHQATVTVKEPQKLSLHCIVSGAIPPVRRIHWSIGEANLTSVSELFVEFSASDDAYTSRSVLALNVTRRCMARARLQGAPHHVAAGSGSQCLAQRPLPNGPTKKNSPNKSQNPVWSIFLRNLNSMLSTDLRRSQIKSFYVGHGQLEFHTFLKCRSIKGHTSKSGGCFL
ncbi:uncharacterized protein CEXT_638351 [Caerostris extrusa]|uniref:Ig-like domain-containing protein n=1 Tax=Caerostris extrusa TaxID=172846 RepID=A0AAV4SR17_CAEEX|nr:uncharacterized protein CEXT_638351 [Caerostris extrusa]